MHGLQPTGLIAFLGSGMFLDGAFANWQAAILQLASLIVFSVFLIQRGAAHSRRAPIRRRRMRYRQVPQRFGRWIFRHSLSFAFLTLFFGSFALHAWFGMLAYNETRALSHLSPLSIGAFVVSAKFWFSTLQTWEAEFLAIALYLLLSIILRERGSPESKRINAPDRKTGETYE